MKTKFLFPNQFKPIGWLLLIPSAIIGILIIFYDFELKFLNSKVFAIYSDGMHFMGGSIIFGFDKNNITNEIFGILFLIGAIFVAFSKEKQEDEFISKTRLESLLWATYMNYAVLIFCFLFFFGTGFFIVMIFNMYTILIFFIIRFNYILYKTRKSFLYEK
jgi:small-conductance mechanosensitive channel